MGLSCSSSNIIYYVSNIIHALYVCVHVCTCKGETPTCLVSSFLEYSEPHPDPAERTAFAQEVLNF